MRGPLNPLWRLVVVVFIVGVQGASFNAASLVFVVFFVMRFLLCLSYGLMPLFYSLVLLLVCIPWFYSLA